MMLPLCINALYYDIYYFCFSEGKSLFDKTQIIYYEVYANFRQYN